MPIETHIEVLDIDVNLSSKGVTFSGSGITDDAIHIKQAMALIRLRLVLHDGMQGAFPTNPIQWAQDGQPVPQPAYCTVRRAGPSHCILEVINSAQVVLSTYFYVIVQSGDQFLGGDPTVLNLPPGGGGTPAL